MTVLDLQIIFKSCRKLCGNILVVHPFLLTLANLAAMRKKIPIGEYHRMSSTMYIVTSFRDWNNFIKGLDSW